VGGDGAIPRGRNGASAVRSLSAFGLSNSLSLLASIRILAGDCGRISRPLPASRNGGKPVCGFSRNL